MDTLGLPHEDYADTPRSVQRIWDGDLDAMLDPGLGRKDDQVVLDTTWHYRYTSSFRSEEDITITTENDRGTGRLLMFRDSFGSSLAPLLVQDYQTVTLVDLRYISSQLLPQFIDFHGQDVLFLYSPSVYNNSAMLK